MADKKINTVLYDLDQSSDTTDEQKATARANIGAQAELTAGAGLTLDGNTFAADAAEIQPWKYFNNHTMSQNWTSKVDTGTCILDAADIASGIIKIPFDNVQWPLTTSDVQYCLCSFNGVRLYKRSAVQSLAGQVWKGSFGWSNTRSADRYDYSNTPICHFSWTWTTNGLFTDYAGGWSFIMDMNPRGTDSFINLEFDFRDYKQYFEAGDELDIGGFIWPLSLKVFNYTY